MRLEPLDVHMVTMILVVHAVIRLVLSTAARLVIHTVMMILYHVSKKHS